MNICRLLASLAVLLHITHALAAEVSVSAAASLKDALTEIASAYEKQSGDKLVFNLGASNLLARLILEKGQIVRRGHASEVLRPTSGDDSTGSWD